MDSVSRAPRSSGNFNTSRSGRTPQGYLFRSEESSPLTPVPLLEPDRAQRLREEMELLGFTVSGHPLDQFDGIAWDTYCPIRDLARYTGQRVTTCGLIIA